MTTLFHFLNSSAVRLAMIGCVLVMALASQAPAATTTITVEPLLGPTQVGEGVSNFVSFNGSTYFLSGGTGYPIKLWKTDGTANGTTMVYNTGISNDILTLITNGTYLYFSINADYHLWKSDGTTSGTGPLTSTVFTTTPQNMIFDGNGLLYFNGSNKLYSYDGTNFTNHGNPSTGAGPYSITSVNNNIFFMGYDNTHTQYQELFVYVPGTGFTQLTTGSGGQGYGVEPEFLTALGNNLLFTGYMGSTANFYLWAIKYDGTGLTAISTLPWELQQAPVLGNGVIYYEAFNPSTSDAQLFQSDGTLAGTKQVTEINAPGSAGSEGAGLDPSGYYYYNGNTYLDGDFGAATGTELGIINSANPGGVLLKDIYTGSSTNTAPPPATLPNSSYPYGFTGIGSTVFFTASTDPTGAEFDLYETTGTTPSTVFLNTIDHGNGIFGGGNPIGHLIYFSSPTQAAGLDTGGSQLYVPMTLVGVTKTAGDSQTVAPSTAAATALQVQITNTDGTANVAGVPVTFVAPGSGASGTFAGGSASATVTTNASGLATAPTYTANSSLGAYSIDVQLGGLDANVNFSVTNGTPTPVAPTVGTNPGSTTVDAGQTATFTAAASGTPTPTVQWQVNTGSGFNNISGATSTTLTVSSVTAGMSGYQYEAVFTNSVNSATTSAATLTVDSASAIIGSPSNHTISAGGSTAFTASASGNPTPTVQWQVSTNNGSSYNNVSNTGVYSNATTTTLNITNAPPSMGGYKYQAVFSNTLFGAGSPTTATSNAATLTFNAPTVTTNAGNILAANAGTVTITGTGFDPTPGNNSVSFTDGAVGTVSSASTTSLTVTFTTKPATAGSLTALVTTDSQNSGSAVQVATVFPVITAMTTNVGINSTTVTINGFGFDTIASNNTVTFSDGAVGTVSAATGTSLTITFSTEPANSGNLTASVTTDSASSGAAVQVATVVPVVQFSVAAETVNQSAGTFSVTVALTGAGGSSTFASAGLNVPFGVAVDKAGNVYVCNFSSGTVSQYNSSGTLLNASFISGVPDAEALAFDASGNLYVTYNFSLIAKYNSAGTLVNSAYISGLSSPLDLAFDAAGNLYVTNSGSGEVSQYSSSGTLLKAAFVSGLNTPTGLAFDASGNLYVNNYGGTVGKYNSAGSPINTSFISGLDYPADLAIDAAGNLYIASVTDNTVLEYNSGGTLISSSIAPGLEAPYGVALDSNGNLYVTNYATNTVTKVTPVTNVTVPFTLSGTAVLGVDYSSLTASPLVIGPGQASATITGTLPANPGASQTLTFTLGTPTGGVLGSPAVNTLTIVEPPLVTSSTASLPANATTVTINGAGFAPVITGAITGASNASPIVITSANHGLLSGQQVTISGVGGNTAANGTWTITMIDGNTFSLVGSTGNGAYTSGGTWSLVPDDAVVFNDGAVGTVTSLTDTALTVTFSTLPVTAGPLTATVTVNGQSGSTTQVATVIPVITSSTMQFGITGNTLVINGFGFSTTSNTVVFSDGTVGTVSGTPTTTQITVTISTDPTHVGVLNATVTSNGASGTSTQVATVVPIAGPVTIMRQPTTGVTVTAATITAGVTDPDPTDTLTLVSVGTPAHGSTRLLNGQVAYLPAHGWTTGDSFTYTVQDDAGTQISGTVTVGIIGSSGAATMSINNPTVQPGGAVLLTFSGVPNTVYGIQYSATMAVGSWVNLVDVTTDQYGDGQYTDNTHPGVSGFYRLIYPGF